MKLIDECEIRILHEFTLIEKKLKQDKDFFNLK